MITRTEFSPGDKVVVKEEYRYQYFLGITPGMVLTIYRIQIHLRSMWQVKFKEPVSGLDLVHIRKLTPLEELL
jgi:hypothetical protein